MWDSRHLTTLQVYTACLRGKLNKHGEYNSPIHALLANAPTITARSSVRISDTSPPILREVLRIYLRPSIRSLEHHPKIGLKVLPFQSALNYLLKINCIIKFAIEITSHLKQPQDMGHLLSYCTMPCFSERKRGDETYLLLPQLRYPLGIRVIGVWTAPVSPR
jgi:hypothetical protein